MLDERLIDLLVDRLVERIESTNTYILEQIGESIKYIGTLTPSKAQQLVQILKYGGNYDKIVDKLAKVTQLNVNEIYEIFEEVAKNDYRFAKQFYDYRGVKYIPYEDNTALKRQIEALASITAGQYTNISNTLAFARKVNGRTIYTDLSRTYQDIIDRAVLSISQGKETFDTEMRKAVKELSNSGIRTVDYASGRSQRLDSAVRMNLKGALRNLHNETQAIFGKEFGADMIEISVHEHPAPDHFMQGKQFLIEEYEKMQNHLPFKDLEGNNYEPLDRPISELNCYHYVFYGIAGISKPNYTNKELEKILIDNEKGIEIDGEKYTIYELSQMQRELERNIKNQKDLQIMGKAAGNKEIVSNSQLKISQLTQKYKQISEMSGLPTKLERAKVTGYKRVNVNKL